MAYKAILKAISKIKPGSEAWRLVRPDEMKTYIEEVKKLGLTKTPSFKHTVSKFGNILKGGGAGASTAGTVSKIGGMAAVVGAGALGAAAIYGQKKKFDKEIEAANKSTESLGKLQQKLVQEKKKKKLKK